MSDCQSTMCATSGCMFPQDCPNDKREPALSSPDGEPTANELKHTLDAVYDEPIFGPVTSRRLHWLADNITALLALRAERDEASNALTALEKDYGVLLAERNAMEAENAELRARNDRHEKAIDLLHADLRAHGSAVP